MPCRIVICFVPTNSKIGDYSSNPYDFERSWTVTSNSEVSEENVRERILEQKLSALQEQLIRLQSSIEQNSVQSRKGKGRGKNSGKSDQNLLSRLRTSFSGQAGPADDESVASSSHSLRSSTSIETPPPPYRENVEASKTIYIKKVELLLNGQAVDQVNISIILFGTVTLVKMIIFI